ncbi:hypothetical protein PtA15_8A713 [Puccinia triticina]|uniref:TRAF-type domain-containing protein n=1 Tax=Puccinia triticina TaxID=208348 RepID=A0ABY7CUL2_9BASI|nr:uncharacterized protein PtA15_8A713 [Puccinia triticina]WAQ87806.1 hypothetical protein PtA15_8A713 [Puccinia triticina]
MGRWAAGVWCACTVATRRVRLSCPFPLPGLHWPVPSPSTRNHCQHQPSCSRPADAHPPHPGDMPPKRPKPSASRSADSPWRRCPRAPCLVSYHPKNAHRHLASCRYFSCSNEHCSFLGTQTQVDDHESGCPYGLRSEEIGTTDPLSESPSEVLDILTSPNRVHSYPTDPSSGVSPASSHTKPCVARQARLDSQDDDPPSSCDGSPVQSSSRLTRLTMPSDSATITRARPGQRRSTLDPYDPSAKRIFSLPDEAIHPGLKPGPPKPAKCSSPVPPPPTRRLATYELQRYRPEPRSLRPRLLSTDTKPSPKLLAQNQQHQEKEEEGIAEALAHSEAQLEAVKECYSALLKSFDDIAYSISQNKASHELQEELGRVPLEEFDRVLSELNEDGVPERAFLADIVRDDFADHVDDDDDDDDDDDEQKECTRRAATGKKKKKKKNLGRPTTPAGRMKSPDSSSDAGFDPHELLTSDELADQVRLKIAAAEAKSSSPLPLDSPSNVFGRKRKRPDPASSPLPLPTRFVHKLADTTIDLGDEIQPGLPSCCNFNKLIQAAKARIQTRLDLRNQRLRSPSP